MLLSIIFAYFAAADAFADAAADIYAIHCCR